MRLESDLIAAAPELFVAVAAMALLMLGVFRGEASARGVAWLTVMVLIAAAALVLGGPEDGAIAFNGLFVVDRFAEFAKVLILLGTALAVVMSMGYAQRANMERFEFPVLLLLAGLGMMMMVSANDLIALYLGVELQSLALYVVAAFRRDSLRSSEAGLKYFVLGALSSGLLLYGASMVYGFSGTTNFVRLGEILGGGEPSLGLVVGLVFIVAGLAFKVSAVPFHMWTPDVYEGAPTPVTAFLAVAPKVAAMALIIRVLFDPFGALIGQWQQVVIAISIASMVLGSFAAINQSNIKRLMAYSSIAHMGFVLVGVAAGNESGVQGVLLYLAVYLFMNVGAFTCILLMRREGRMVEGIADLAGLSRTQPVMAAAMAIFMFSLAGIPPLAGFFGKLYVFLAAIEAARSTSPPSTELYALVVIGLLASVVGAFYYLRIVKLMYFDEPVGAFDRPLGGSMTAILAGTALVTLLFFIVLAPVLDGAAEAAAVLFAA
ncbi:MAG: NADH-quinone oxidoreductase subunit NuoN [Alphaproteobacteria bacterium]